jgi:hypothetical protein
VLSKLKEIAHFMVSERAVTALISGAWHSDKRTLCDTFHIREADSVAQSAPNSAGARRHNIFCSSQAGNLYGARSSR